MTKGFERDWVLTDPLLKKLALYQIILNANQMVLMILILAFDHKLYQFFNQTIS
jgi:hypothetical protein